MIKYFVVAVITAIATYMLRDTVSSLSYASYKDTLGALMNISSIIFAIIGAWIAIIYPRAIGRVFKGQAVTEVLNEADSDANYLSNLVEIVMVSALVLMIVLLIQFVAPIARIFVQNDSILYAKYALFYVISMLTFSQLYAIFRVILANYFFLNELRHKNVHDKTRALHE